MPRLKIAVIGAGSYVFGPSVLKDVLLEHRLADVELALMDPAGDLVELTAAVGQRIARDTGVNATVTAHTDRAQALDGADFVLNAAAVQMKRRFATDSQLIQLHYPGHLITEFGGVAGISYSLRQIALIDQLAADIRRLCPKAWLFNSANPLPRVCQAAHEAGVRTVGFCSVSLVGYAMLASILDGTPPAKYPFEGPRSQYDAGMVGTNHLTWIAHLVDRSDGSDAVAALRGRARAGGTSGNPMCERILKQTGYLISAGDGHCQDFLPPAPESRSVTDSSHGTADDRQKRLALLKAIAEGRSGWEPLLAKESWEKPIDLLVALAHNKPTRFHALNLVNERQQVKSLPKTAFVETPAGADARAIFPDHIDLPEPCRPHNVLACQVTDAIVKAAQRRSRTLVHAAVDLDPTITDKAKGHTAMDACLDAHADLIGTFGS